MCGYSWTFLWCFYVLAIILFNFKMLPRDYQKSYDEDDSDNIIKEKWIMDLSQEEGNFVSWSINQMVTIKYWDNKIWNIITAKEKIP